MKNNTLEWAFAESQLIVMRIANNEVNSLPDWFVNNVESVEVGDLKSLKFSDIYSLACKQNRGEVSIDPGFTVNRLDADSDELIGLVQEILDKQ